MKRRMTSRSDWKLNSADCTRRLVIYIGEIDGEKYYHDQVDMSYSGFFLFLLYAQE